MSYALGSPLPAGERTGVAEALLSASRATHAAVGLFSTSKLSIVDADVASTPEGGAPAEALDTICRTFGLHAFRHDPAAEADSRAESGADSSAERGVLWLSSERCLIGLDRKRREPTPFVALVRPRGAQAFPRWQREVARIALYYETGRLDWSRPANDGAGALDEIMSRLEIAFAVVDAGRAVLYANPAAGAWLRGQEALRLADGRLCGCGPERQRQFATAVQGATVAEHRRAQALVIRRAEAGGGPATVVSVLPLPGGDLRALVVFGTPARSGETADLLLGAFGLTGAERRLARCLLTGLTLEEAAEGAQIRISTARGYLKSIFAKTGVRRQGEFVAVIGALVPPVSLPLPA